MKRSDGSREKQIQRKHVVIGGSKHRGLGLGSEYSRVKEKGNSESIKRNLDTEKSQKEKLSVVGSVVLVRVVVCFCREKITGKRKS